ncbi:MAG TPA: protein kinase [Polyangiaceae bacterium]
MSASSAAASELDRAERASESPQAAPAGFASSNEALPLPRAFGRLLLLKLIARGGMGDVYLAATTGIEGAERPCVVKTVRRDHIHDGSFLARFLDEARVQSQLNHPGVAQVLEASTDENGEPYTVVEYVEGRSLSDVRARAIQLGARVGWPEAVSIAIEMANALGHVHERAGSDGTPLGIVHRDLSPQNVMVGYVGEVKLIDFGTARGQNRKCHTVAGVVFAKPGYVAPEVARQQVGDARIDLYALGIMLWELCAGRRFLVGDPQKHLEEAAAGDVKVPLLADLVSAPKELDEIIQKLVANQPDERYVNASQGAADMGRVLAMAPPGKNGERSVRGRIHALMRTLWPHEPARSRGDFAKLLKTARAARTEVTTPVSNRVMEIAAQHMNDDPSVLSGTPYKLVEKIGEGASGVVWKGEHVELGRSLAIKVLSPGHGSASDAVERFRREARAVARLSHPNLVQLYDFGRSLDGRVFLAMELLHGATLDDHLAASRGMDWREAVRLAVDACNALQAAHEAGLVHRDLKPANLFLTEAGTVKLLDFGVAMALADVAGAEERRQKGFAIFGTPEYMAPEQVAGEAVDARCDLYAMGCLLYELLTGSCPFEGPSSVVVMGKQLREIADPVRVRAPRKGIPEELEAVVLKLLAKKPEARFSTAAEVRAALEETLRLPTKRQTRVRMVAGAFVAGAMALSIGAGLVSYRALHSTPREPEVAFAPVITQAEAEPATPVAAPPSTGTSDIPAPPPPLAEAAPAPAPAPQAPAPAPHAVAHAAVHAAPRATESAPASESASARETESVSARATESASEPATTTASASEPASEPAPSADASAPRADLLELADARTNAHEHSDDPRTLKVWANAAFRAGALREARRAGEAWALRDDGAEPRVFLANVLDATGHRGDARAVLEQWIELHPDSTEARHLRSRAQIVPPRTTERVLHKTDR